MAKYHELIRKYQGEMKEIKKLKAIADEARRKLDNFKTDWSLQAEDRAEELNHAWQQAYDSLQVEYEELSRKVNTEYEDVPFGKTASQGVEGFWKAAGIY